jgi:rSAM/selenodomain-associated transferase 1
VDACIQIFAKAPLPGLVKTRLIPALDAAGAAALYKKMLRHCLANAAGIAPLQLWCSPDSQHEFLQDCARRSGAELYAQQGRDLGERMQNALAAGLRRYARVVLIGSDCPIMDAAYLRAALAKLEQVGVALGPAEDGGYVLIGASGQPPPVFQGMAWSQPEVLARTRDKLRQAGLAWAELPALWDVDSAADLPRLRGVQWTSFADGEPV